MCNRSTKSSLEHWAQAVEDQIHSQTEEFPPSSLTKSDQDRAGFYQTLNSCEGEVAEKLLSSICMLIADQQVTNRTLPRDSYEEKYKELEKLVQKICEHNLVRNWSGVGTIELFSPQDFKCRHGKTIRFKKKCRMIRGKLELLRSSQSLLKKIPKNRITARARRIVENRQKKLLQWLSKEKIDVQTANLDDYCSNDTLFSEDRHCRLTFGDSIAMRKPGAQAKQFQNEVIVRLMPLLLKCHANSSAASDALETVFGSFFGLKIDGESLERQWRRLAKKKHKRNS